MGSFCSIKNADKPVVNSYLDSTTDWVKRREAQLRANGTCPGTAEEHEAERVVSLQSAIRSYLARKRLIVHDAIDFSDDESIPPQLSTAAVSDPSVLLPTTAIATLQRLPPRSLDRSVAGVFSQPPRLLADDSIYVGEWSFRSHGTTIKGKGKMYHKSGAYSEGYWKNGLLFYRGRLITPDGDLYEGNFEYGKPSGICTFESFDLKNVYKGRWSRGKRNGDGHEIMANGAVYMGQYRKGKKHGKGVMTWRDNSKYEGEFRKDQVSGFGTYLWSDGRSYTGDVVNGKMHGQGTFQYPDGKTYTGDYIHDKKSGKGIYRWDGKEYNGEWKDGKMHGLGYLTSPHKGMKMYHFQEGTRVREILEDN